MIFFEFPFNERIRNYLRLEHLFSRFADLSTRETALDHHFALLTLFELAEMGLRNGNDLRADIHKDLERHLQLLQTYRSHPDIDLTTLQTLMQDTQSCLDGLVQSVGKMGKALAQDDWLHNIRSRIHIPGGTCAFDLPAYYMWQSEAPKQRQQDLQRCAQSYQPWAACVQLILRLLRLSSQRQSVTAKGPARQYQQTLDGDRSYQLASVGIDPALSYYPVISGTRHLFSVRFHPRSRPIPPMHEDRGPPPIADLPPFATASAPILPQPSAPAPQSAAESTPSAPDGIPFILTLSS